MGMKLNPNKIQSMIVGRSRIIFPLQPDILTAAILLQIHVILLK